MHVPIPVLLVEEFKTTPETATSIAYSCRSATYQEVELLNFQKDITIKSTNPLGCQWTDRMTIKNNSVLYFPGWGSLQWRYLASAFTFRDQQDSSKQKFAHKI